MQHPLIKPDQRSNVKTVRHWILPVLLSLIINVGILQLLVVMLATLEPVATEYSRIDVRLLLNPKQEPPPLPVAKTPEPVVKPPEPKPKPVPPPQKVVKTLPPLPKKTLEPPAPEPPKDIAASQEAPADARTEADPFEASIVNEAPKPVTIVTTSPQPKNEVIPLFRLTRMPKIVDYNLDTLKRFYPEEERDFGKEATVEAMILVDENGDVVEVEIIKSAGERFDAAAKKALLSKALVIQPGYIGDRPVASRVPIPITFNLTD